MSSFNCEYCGASIQDTPRGYVTGCEHFPLEHLSPAQSERHFRWLKTLKTIAERSKEEK